MKTIVGRSDQNLSGAVDMLPDVHVRFSQANENEYLLTSDENKKNMKILRRKSDGLHILDRQLSTAYTKLDQFQVNDFILDYLMNQYF